MTYSSYPQYEKTIAYWIDKRPAHWEERKLKFSVQLVNEKIDAKDSSLEYMGLEHIESWTGKKIDGNIFNSDGVASRFEKNDVLFGKLRPYLAKVYKAENEGVASTEALILRADSIIHPEFLKFYLLSSEFINVVDGSTYGSKMPRANWDFIGNLSILLPHIDEQIKIAAFLDHKTAQIDRLIEKKKALIEKLNEKRLALITRAVTKGLRPDAPMQPSGVDWLGDVPAHWAVRRLRFAIQSNPVKSEIDYLADDDLVSFVPMDAVGEYGGMRLEMEKPLDEVYNGYTYFRDNDVVIAKITPCFENGKGAIAEGLTNGVAFGTTELHVLRPLVGYSSRWLFYLSTCHAFREIGAAEMYGAGGQKRVPESFIKDFRIGIPDFDEQESIADFIASEIQNLDAMLRLNDQAIERLAEYRTALITAAVTGKIDARNVESRK